MSPTPFGQLPNGEIVEAFDLSLPDGSGCRIITLGAIITTLRVPDKRGDLADVVLGFDHLEGYLGPHPYFGAIVGRVAGRITGATFEIDGRTYPLAVNQPPNHLHGGVVGFSHRNWSATPLTRADGSPSLRLEYHSPHEEEGYPGNVDAAVTYTFTLRHELIVEIEAVTDRTTPFSLTQHSYFNLRGEGSGNIEDHRLQILADRYAPTDDHMGLLGRSEPVTAPGNDFNQTQRIGDVLSRLHKHHGDLYFLPARSGLTQVARVEEPVSGRVLTVRTDEPCLQFYTGVNLDDSMIGKSGQPSAPYAGLCLEAEGYPDGPNSPELGDILLHPGQIYRRTTVYAFSNLPSS